MFLVKNIEEMEHYSNFLVKEARKWISINRLDLDPESDIRYLLTNEVIMFPKFDPFDVNEDGTYSLRLVEYAFCNKKYADEIGLALTPQEGGNMGNENQYLKFKKYKVK